ncbi:hypothetical protein NL676_019524 [Syzygium grande]|nr:hypothetical protein NL676_019524 [Syzygium grande]
MSVEMTEHQDEKHTANFPRETTTNAERNTEFRNQTPQRINIIERSGMISSGNPNEQARRREVTCDLTRECTSSCGQEGAEDFSEKGLKAAEQAG